MADSSQPFVRALRRQNVDVDEVFAEGVKQHSDALLASASDGDALIQQIAEDFKDAESPFDAADSAAK